jgi:hypothetical protein
MTKPQSMIQGFSDKEYKFYYAMLLIVLVIILVPIWLVKYPGMVDYPNHLVRCYILSHFHDNPVWGQRYYLDYTPLPNLAIDLIVTPLLRLFPLLVCGKIFLSLAAALYVLGCSEVGRAVAGKPNWLALICAFTFYNSQLFFGFVNYIFGVGVFLCVLAYWMRVRSSMSFSRFFICCLLGIVAFLAHLSSVVILGVACVTIALLDFALDRRIRGLIVKISWLACPLVLMAGFMKGSGRVGIIEWGAPYQKLMKLFSPVRSYSAVVDMLVIVVLLICALLMLRGSRIRSTALVSIELFILFLITPETVFTSTSADARYVIPCFLLLVLSFEPRWGRWQKAALAMALVAMTLRTVSITTNWLAISRRNEQVLAMGQVLPTGARIYVLQPKYLVSTKLDRGFVHIIEFWTVSHEADISTLFALPGQQPLVFRQPPCDGPDWSKCLASYDYVWTYDPPASMRQAILRLATPAAEWEKVTLWRVTRTAVSQPR